MKIAVSGKGGTGKTTIAALIIRCLLDKNIKPILAVDADPSADLGYSLGVKFDTTVGKVLDEFLKQKDDLPTGVVKEALIDSKLSEILVEEKGFDLLVMGRGEGPNCYCYPNAVIRNFIDKLSANYKYVIIDNEAGMEHISRRTNGDLNILFLVSDPTIKGIKTSKKLEELVKELGLNVENIYLIINRVQDELPKSILEEVKKQSLNLIQVIPEDKSIKDCDTESLPIFNLSHDSPSMSSIKNLIEKIKLS